MGMEPVGGVSGGGASDRGDPSGPSSGAQASTQDQVLGVSRSSAQAYEGVWALWVSQSLKRPGAPHPHFPDTEDAEK